jgi:Uma2 family endonuclease
MTAVLRKPEAPEPPTLETIADLCERLGGIDPSRILLKPAPGMAVEQDVVDINDHTNRLFELVEGTLVEKPMGVRESRVAAMLIQILGAFAESNDLGIVLAPDGMLRLAPGLVRMPDVSFLLWNRFPERKLPVEPIPDLAADLAIEVLSKSNTKREMRRKTGEYFAAGTRCVWLVDPVTRSIEVFSSPTSSARFTGDDPVAVGDLLPGLSLTPAELFRRAGLE